MASPETNRRSDISEASSLTKRTSQLTLDSPASNRSNNSSSPSGDATGAIKKTDLKLVETPTQTTDTLLAGSPVNVSVNVQCSVDVQSPKCKTSLEIVPQQPWAVDPVSPRSYTSVNLTLRPPSSEPQAPIDITSQNSSLTYSTSTFDHQNGLQSRLQITVGPGGSSTVSSVRARPRSSYLPAEVNVQPTMPVRAESLPDLAVKNSSKSYYST